MESTPDLGYIPGVKPRGGFVFIGVLLLLIHDDQTDIFQGGKHRATGAYHHLNLSPADAFPFIQPLPHRKGTVKDGHIIAKASVEMFHRLGGQGDFRHHDDDCLSVGNDLPGQLEENRGFSASRYPIQQGGAVFPFSIKSRKLVIGFLLVF